MVQNFFSYFQCSLSCSVIPLITDMSVRLSVCHLTVHCAELFRSYSSLTCSVIPLMTLYLSVCPSVSPPVYQTLYLSVHPSVYLSINFSAIRPFTARNFFNYFFLSSFSCSVIPLIALYLSVRLSHCLFVRLSVRLSICPPFDHLLHRTSSITSSIVCWVVLSFPSSHYICPYIRLSLCLGLYAV